MKISANIQSYFVHRIILSFSEPCSRLARLKESNKSIVFVLLGNDKILQKVTQMPLRLVSRQQAWQQSQVDPILGRDENSTKTFCYRVTSKPVA